MYEFGVYDGVKELCGRKAKVIRDQCIFPKSHTYNNKPLYLKKKLYYIDLNSSYLAGIEQFLVEVRILLRRTPRLRN